MPRSRRDPIVPCAHKSCFRDGDMRCRFWDMACSLSGDFCLKHANALAKLWPCHSMAYRRAVPGKKLVAALVENVRDWI